MDQRKALLVLVVGLLIPSLIPVARAQTSVEVTRDPSEEHPPADQPVEISAHITTSSPIDHVSLDLMINLLDGLFIWGNITMYLDSGVWKGTIRGFPSNTVVRYQISVHMSPISYWTPFYSYHVFPGDDSNYSHTNITHFNPTTTPSTTLTTSESSTSSTIHDTIPYANDLTSVLIVGGLGGILCAFLVIAICVKKSS